MVKNKVTHRETLSLRLERLRRAISERDFEGIIIVPGPNLRYFTGVNSLLLERPFFLLVPREGKPHLVAPTLESGPYLRAPIELAVHSWDDMDGPRRAIGEAAEELGIRGKWGVEGRTPFGYLHSLLMAARPEFENAETLVQGLREVKDSSEIHMLQRAATILAKSFLKIPDLLKPGSTEIDLANDIAQAIQANDAESAQDVLVQSGAMSADSHHLPTPRRIKRQESVVVDATCTYAGYVADITRTFIIGKNVKFEKLYSDLLDAQVAGIDAVHRGVTVGSIDGATRSRLKQHGLEKLFVHRTGHGLGLEVHEAPYIVPDGKEVIDAGMVFTVEPGVYLRGEVGLRIEDDLLVTERGKNVLTKVLPKDFEWWK